MLRKKKEFIKKRKLSKYIGLAIFLSFIIPTSVLSETVIRHQYDDLNRLKSTVNTNSVEEYTYDEIGNILTKGVCTEWYQDADNDGYSNGNIIPPQCERPAGYKSASELIATSGDCSDNDSGTHPGATETCDGLDNDCSGALPASLVLQDQTIGFGYHLYETTGTITADTNFIIGNGADVTFCSGSTIHLGNGFRAQIGSTFHTNIQ